MTTPQKITKNPKALRVVSAFISTAVFQLAVYCAFTALVLNRPKYGFVRLFFANAGIGLGCMLAFAIAFSLFKKVTCSLANVDTNKAQDVEKLAKTAGFRSPRVEYLSAVVVLTAFCVGLDVLSRTGKFDRDLALRAITWISVLGAIGLVPLMGGLFLGESHSQYQYDNPEGGNFFDQVKYQLYVQSQKQSGKSEHEAKEIAGSMVKLEQVELSSINLVVAAARI